MAFFRKTLKRIWFISEGNVESMTSGDIYVTSKGVFKGWVYVRLEKGITYLNPDFVIMVEDLTDEGTIA